MKKIHLLAVNRFRLFLSLALLASCTGTGDLGVDKGRNSNGSGAGTVPGGPGAPGGSGGGPTGVSGPTVQWIKTASAATNAISLSVGSIAVDPAGNAYMISTTWNGGGPYDFGNGVTYAPAANARFVMVKYNADGLALWAKAVATTSSVDAYVNKMVADAAGNLYVVGSQWGGNINYGCGNIGGTSSQTSNSFIIKFDSNGNCLWSHTPINPPDRSAFINVAVDSAGNSYAVGYQVRGTSYTYSGVSASGGHSGGYNAVIVKFNGSGAGVWARSVVSGNTHSMFLGVGVDSAGNVSAVGEKDGSVAGMNFGTGVINGPMNFNPIIVRYNAAGIAQWARTTTPGSDCGNYFYAAVVDGSGNTYVAGQQGGNTNCNYGNGVVNTNFGMSGVFVKYSPTGNATWATASTCGLPYIRSSRFESLFLDSAGNLIGLGLADQTSCDYGNGVTVTGVSDANSLIMSVDSSGKALWGQTTASGAGSYIRGAGMDGSGAFYYFGEILGAYTTCFAAGQCATGSITGGRNPVLVKYR